MTGDDPGNGEQRRARQNVIFEIGFFCAAFQRTSGRLILLDRRDIEIPSDMKAIGTVNISGGLASKTALRDLKRELALLGIKPLRSAPRKEPAT